jgi:sugar O-acyltransferase (sialic acid O-acetyltransferase NeuD family)
MSPETPLIVLGGIGTCLDIAEAALLSEKFKVLGLLDDALPAGEVTTLGLPVLGRLEQASSFKQTYFINGIGSPNNFRTRAAILQRVNLEPESFASVIHPAASVSRTASLGRGCAILSHCDLGLNSVVGDHAVMLQQVVLGHDSVVEPWAILAAGVKISGRVHIGAGAYIGAGTVVRQGCRIGAGCLVGAGSVVVRDIPPDTLSYGVPARVQKNLCA